jgi:hypothetical protein
MERFRIITTKALRVPVSAEEILDDLLYPARRGDNLPPRHRQTSRNGKRR